MAEEGIGAMPDRVCRRQWEWRPRGWFVLLTVGGAWGLGFMAHSMRYNGVDIYFGPVVLTVQPPMPEFPLKN